MLKHILLGFLRYQPLTGYDLKLLIDNSTGHFWHAYHSQIYTTLRKLEGEGLVSSTLEGPDERLGRRVYTLTATGEAELQQWQQNTLTELPQAKEELLVRLFFAGLRPRADVLSELRLQRHKRAQQLEVYKAIDPLKLLKEIGGPEAESRWLISESHYWLFTLKYGVAFQKMYLGWLDETIASLEGMTD